MLTPAAPPAAWRPRLLSLVLVGGVLGTASGACGGNRAHCVAEGGWSPNRRVGSSSPEVSSARARRAGRPREVSRTAAAPLPPTMDANSPRRFESPGAWTDQARASPHVSGTSVEDESTPWREGGVVGVATHGQEAAKQHGSTSFPTDEDDESTGPTPSTPPPPNLAQTSRPSLPAPPPLSPSRPPPPSPDEVITATAVSVPVILTERDRRRGGGQDELDRQHASVADTRPGPSPDHRSGSDPEAHAYPYWGYPYPHPWRPPPTIGFGSPLPYPIVVRGVLAPECLRTHPPGCTCFGPFTSVRPWGYYCILRDVAVAKSPPPANANPPSPPPVDPNQPPQPPGAPPLPPGLQCGDPSIPVAFSCAPPQGEENSPCGFCVFDGAILNCCCDPQCGDYDDCCEDFASCCLLQKRNAEARRKVPLSGENRDAIRAERRRKRGESRESEGPKEDVRDAREEVPKPRRKGGGNDITGKEESVGGDACSSLRPGDAAVRAIDGRLLLRREAAMVAVDNHGEPNRSTGARVDEGKKKKRRENAEEVKKGSAFSDACISRAAAAAPDEEEHLLTMLRRLGSNASVEGD